jgi:AraC family transcriptional regulator, arabinose operon regulatory protein
MEKARRETIHPPFFPFTQIAPAHKVKRQGYAVWRQQGTDDWLLNHTIAGQGRIGFAGGETTVKAGDAVIIRPGALHDYGTAPNAKHWEIVWTHFRPKPGWMELLNWDEAAPGLLLLNVKNPEVARRIEVQLKEMNRVARSATPKREAFALNALEKALLMYDDYRSTTVAGTLDPRIAVVVEHLRVHLREKFDLPKLAQISQLSASHFYHLFSTETGQPPYEFLEFLRMDQAKHLLETSRLKIQNVAAEVGFEDALNFSRRFKHRVGLSPRTYRHNMITMPDSEKIDHD